MSANVRGDTCTIAWLRPVASRTREPTSPTRWPSWPLATEPTTSMRDASVDVTSTSVLPSSITAPAATVVLGGNAIVAPVGSVTREPRTATWRRPRIGIASSSARGPCTSAPKTSTSATSPYSAAGEPHGAGSSRVAALVGNSDSPSTRALKSQRINRSSRVAIHT